MTYLLIGITIIIGGFLLLKIFRQNGIPAPETVKRHMRDGKAPIGHQVLKKI